MSDFVAHLTRQAAFSRATWGPGRKVERVFDNVRKEIEEIQRSNGSSNELVDLAILSLEGLLRSIMFDRDDNIKLTSDEVFECAVSLIKFMQGQKEKRGYRLKRATQL